MECYTHLLGSHQGYRPLAWSQAIESDDLALLSSIDLGQPRQSDVHTLDTHVMACCRALPSGRIALTRCLAGGQDDAGRSTLVFPTLVMEWDDWRSRVAPGLGQVLHDALLWRHPTFAQGGSIELPLKPQSPRLTDAGAQLLDLLRRQRQLEAGTLLLTADTDLLPALSSLIGILSTVQRSSLQWGVGVFAPARWMDIAQCATGATGGAGAAVPLAHAWHDPAVAHLIGQTTLAGTPRPTPEPTNHIVPARPTQQPLGLPRWVVFTLLALMVITGVTWFSIRQSVVHSPATQTVDTSHDPIEDASAPAAPPKRDQKPTGGSLTQATQHGLATRTSTELDVNAVDEAPAASSLPREASPAMPVAPDSTPSTPALPPAAEPIAPEATGADDPMPSTPVPTPPQPLATPSLPVLVAPNRYLTNSDFAKELQVMTDALNRATQQLGGGQHSAHACSAHMLQSQVAELARDTKYFQANFLSPAANEEAERLCHMMSAIDDLQRARSLACSRAVTWHVSEFVTDAAIQATGSGAWTQKPLRERRDQLRVFRARLQCLAELSNSLQIAWSEQSKGSLQAAMSWLSTHASNTCDNEGSWATMAQRYAVPEGRLPRSAVDQSLRRLDEVLGR